MKEKRDETIILRLSKTEKNRIYEKMLSMGIRSLSAYIRKMATTRTSNKSTNLTIGAAAFTQVIAFRTIRSFTSFATLSV